MSIRRTLLLTCIATSLTACTGSATPSTQTVHETQGPAEPSPILPVATVEVDAPAPVTGCAKVGIGLDLNALPTGSSAASIDSYTRTRAEEFTALAADGVTVELGFYAGVSTFEATLRANSNAAALAQCNLMTAAFLPTVPGRPGSRESGGSVIEPCGPCPTTSAACPDAYDLAVTWANQQWPESNVGRDAFEPDDPLEPVDLDHDGSPDLILRHGGGMHNTTHLVFWVRDGCPTFVGEFSASPLFGYACLTETHNGLCDLIASELMIHGEDLRWTYRFNGSSYQQVPGSNVLGKPHR